MQHVQILAQQDQVGSFLGNVDGRVDRDADIGRMQRGRIVDAVAEVTDRVPLRFQQPE